MPDGTPDFSWVSKKPVASTGSVVPVGGVQQTERQQDFDFTLKFNQDNAKLRAQNQRWYTQAGITLGNIIPNVVTGIVEGFAYLPEMFDSNQDYSNAITRTMQEWKNPFGEAYRENPNEVWDMGDPAWWFNNVGMLVESAATFATEGAIIGKLFSSAAKGAGMLASARYAKNVVNVGNRVAQTLTAATLAYTEGAMSGYQIYEKTYKSAREKAINSGATPEEANAFAQQEAGEAAAMTVKVSTAMNTMLNMGVIAPMFKGPDEKLIQWARSQGKQITGEDLIAYRNRIMAATAESAEIRAALKNRMGFISLPAEMVKEGVEEVNTMYAEQVGTRTGEGEKESLFGALTNLERYFKDVTNEEGALNFALGLVGGMAETVLLDNIPSKYVPKIGEDGKAIMQTGADGKILYDDKGKPKYVKELVRPKTYNERGQKEFFQSIKQSILTDITRQEKLHAGLVDAAAKGDQARVESLRAELFSIQALDAVSKGMAENWTEEYNQIGATDNNKDLSEGLEPQIQELKQQIEQAPAEEKAALVQQLDSLLTQQKSLEGVTEAMQKGYAKDKNDNDYKKRAREAVEDLKAIQGIHDLMQKQYADDSNPISKEVADHMFFRKANLHLQRRAIQREQERIDAIENMERMTELLDENLVDREIDRHNRTVAVWNDVIKKLNTDIKLIQEAMKRKDFKVVEEMIGKYKGKGENTEQAWEDTLKKIRMKQKQYESAIQSSTETMKASTRYNAWLEQNPGKSFNDFLASINTNVQLRNAKSNLEHVRTQTDVAQQNLEEVESGKGIQELYKQITSERKKVLDAIEEDVKNSNLETYLREQNKKNAARLTAQEKQVMAAQKQKQINELRKEFNELENLRVDLEHQIKELSNNFGGTVRNFNSIMKLKSRLSVVKAQLSSIRAQLVIAEEQLQELGIKAEIAVQEATNTEAQPAEAIVREEAATETKTVEEEQYDMTYEEMKAADAAAKEPSEYGATEEKSAEDFLNDDPQTTYIKFVQSMPKKVQDKLGELEAEFDKTGSVSSTRISAELTPYVTRGTIEDSDVTAAYFAMRDYMAVKNTPVAPAQQMPVVEQVAEDVKMDEEPQTQESTQPEIFINESSWTNEGLAEQYWASSPKAPTAVKVNSADLQYITIEYNGKIKLRNKTERMDDTGLYAPLLDATSNKDRMLPGRIVVGDAVELIPDTEFDGSINNHHTLEFDEDLETPKVADSFGNYLDKDGKIRVDERFKAQGYANVPIKIVHKRSGKVLGHFPMNDWVGATLGAANTRNIPQLNAAEGIQTNLDIRRRIVEQWNKTGTGIGTVVTGRSTGRQMFAGEVNPSTGKVKYQVRQTAKMIKDPSIVFGFATREQFLVGKGVAASTRVNLSKELTPSDFVGMVRADESRVVSTPVMFLPMPDGSFLPSQLETYKLDRKGDVQTVAKVIEIFLQMKHGIELSTADKNTYDAISKDPNIGFDISTPAGLKGFIEQYYTFTTGFDDAHTLLSAPAETINGKKAKVQRWMISITNSGLIKIGTKYSGKFPVQAALVDGKLSSQFISELGTGLATRFKNVTFTDGNIRGVNDGRKITAITITKDGQLRKFEFDNYNEYLKSFTQTAVYGLHQVDGQYVYGANSQIYLDSSKLLQRKLIIDLPAEESGPLAPDAGAIDDLASQIDDIMFGFPIRIPNSEITPKGTPLTLETLTNLHNFTPVSQRNGKTPGEVMEYLNSLNITTLADGYNPFRKCS